MTGSTVRRGAGARSRSRTPARVVGAAALALALVLGATPASADDAAPPAGASVSLEHLVLRLDGDRLSVFQMMAVENKGGSGVGEVLVDLPAGFSNLEFAGGVDEGKAEVTGSGFVDRQGIEAVGSRQLVFTYDLDLAALSGRLPVNVRYPTGTLFLLAEKGIGFSLSNERLIDNGWADMGDRVFRQYAADSIPAATQLKIALNPGEPGDAPPAGAGTTGGAGASAPAGGQAGPEGRNLITTAFHGGSANVMLWQRVTGLSGHGGMTGAALVFLLLAVIIFAILKFAQSRSRVGPAASGAGPGALQAEKRALLEELKTLELSRRAGGVGDDEYRRRRGELKRRLVGVMTSLER